MSSKDFHELPRVDESLSFLYLDQCRVEQDALAIAAWDLDGIAPIPAASLNCLMLGPGTVITHAAIRAIAENGCNVVWVGERGVRTYACATGETRSSRNILRQAWLATRENLRLEVVTRMYRMRFPEPLPPGLTLQQIRGMEGIRVREAYRTHASRAGVAWDKRSYNSGNWDSATPINKSISAANACLYGLCHAAIVSLGYSPALGFVHSGKQLSFVYDVADLYKTDTSIPAAFDAVREDHEQTVRGVLPKERLELEQRVRMKMRQMFARTDLLSRIPRDLARLFDIQIPKNEEPAELQPPPGTDEEGDPWADDPARPAPLWEPTSGADQTILPPPAPDAPDTPTRKLTKRS